jgi:hypothetical protein
MWAILASYLTVFFKFRDYVATVVKMTDELKEIWKEMVVI